MKLFPKEVNFFELFEKASNNLIVASKTLVELIDKLHKGDKADEDIKKLKDIELENDLVSHEIFRRLNKTFLTPIDREDIYSLTSKLDDVIDNIWSAADRIKIFKITKLSGTGGAIELADSLLTNTETIDKAIHNLRDKKYSYVQELCIVINSLENEADRIFKTALAKLFEIEKDPIMVIKWKEIFEYLEKAANSCEDVADVLETVVIKNV